MNSVGMVGIRMGQSVGCPFHFAVLSANHHRTKPEQNPNHLIHGDYLQPPSFTWVWGRYKYACRGLQCAPMGLSLALSMGMKG